MDSSSRASRAQDVRPTRSWSMGGVELRDGENNGMLRFRGEASVVDQPYTVTDMFGDFTETVRAGAFDRTLGENPDVFFRINHEGIPLARTKSGTMTLAADPNLEVEAHLDPASPLVTGLRSALQRGDMDQMSFAFRVVRQEWDEDYTDRQILEVNLHGGDVSTVTQGANPATSGTLRALQIPTVELDAAVAAITAGTATDEQLALVERAARTFAEMRPTTEVPQSIREDLAGLEHLRFIL